MVNISSRELKTWMRAVYDKVLLFGALFGLLLSLLALIVMVGRERDRLEAVGRAQETARHEPESDRPLDLTALDEALDTLHGPLQLAAWSNRLLVAEMRVPCVGCRRPIPPVAPICPFLNCQTQQPALPPDQPRDKDYDGMPDEWETRHSLNPDVDDATLDADADGFTNLEEFQAGTDPRDPAARPPYVDKLRVVQTGRIPIPLTFEGVQRFSAEDVRFLIKNRLTGRDTYAKMGETVTDYEIVGFQAKTQRVNKVTFFVDEDVSELTLRRNDKTIVLTKGRQNQGETAATLTFLVDHSTYEVKKGDVISLVDSKYKIVDIREDAVIVSDVRSGAESPVQWLPQSQAQP